MDVFHSQWEVEDIDLTHFKLKKTYRSFKYLVFESLISIYHIISHLQKDLSHNALTSHPLIC